MDEFAISFIVILNLLTHSVRSRVKANVHTYSDGQIIKRIQYFVILVIRFALHDLVIFFRTYVICSGKRGHSAQKFLKNELLTWCYSAYLASQNGTYHRAWSPTIAELHALVLSHLQENFNYCIIRKQCF